MTLVADSTTGCILGCCASAMPAQASDPPSKTKAGFALIQVDRKQLRNCRANFRDCRERFADAMFRSLTMSGLLAQQCGADTPHLNGRIGITVTNLFVKSTVKGGLIRKSFPKLRMAGSPLVPKRHSFLPFKRIRCAICIRGNASFVYLAQANGPDGLG